MPTQKGAGPRRSGLPRLGFVAPPEGPGRRVVRGYTEVITTEVFAPAMYL